MLETLEGFGPFTLFAPVNSAFVIAEQELPNPTAAQIADIPLYHVIIGRTLTPRYLRTGEFDAANGDHLGIFVNANGVRINGEDGKVVLSLAVKRKYRPLERQALGIKSSREETDWFGLEIFGRDAE